jgi:DNA-binding winged helix-turn-helix (wHTH) protein
MPPDLLLFEDFELDGGAYVLRRAGRAVRLERIPMNLLFLLAERSGQLVTREEIFERIWGKDVFLDTDNSINAAIRKLRQALDENADAPRFIETVPSKGYRFVAPVAKRPPRRLKFSSQMANLRDARPKLSSWVPVLPSDRQPHPSRKRMSQGLRAENDACSWRARLH